MFVQRLCLEYVEGQKLDRDGFPVQTSIITQSPKYPLKVRVDSRQRQGRASNSDSTPDTHSDHPL
jgi:hypothetical protein